MLHDLNVPLHYLYTILHDLNVTSTSPLHYGNLPKRPLNHHYTMLHDLNVPLHYLYTILHDLNVTSTSPLHYVNLPICDLYITITQYYTTLM